MIKNKGHAGVHATAERHGISELPRLGLKPATARLDLPPLPAALHKLSTAQLAAYLSECRVNSRILKLIEHDELDGEDVTAKVADVVCSQTNCEKHDVSELLSDCFRRVIEQLLAS